MSDIRICERCETEEATAGSGKHCRHCEIEWAAEVVGSHQELATCRAALDKTAIERDGFHGELVAAQGLAIRLGLQVPRWRTIRSAPKDGTFILAGYTYNSKPWILHWDVGRERWLDDDGDEFEDPTHWMPLPEPPKETT